MYVCADSDITSQSLSPYLPPSPPAGDGMAGKSSLAARFAQGEFINHLPSNTGGRHLPSPSPPHTHTHTHTHTHAVVSFSGRVRIDDTEVEFEIWDTHSFMHDRSLAPMYYRGAQAAIVVYDITDMVSHPLSDM